jgi:SAM-dependent methyltransferase
MASIGGPDLGANATRFSGFADLYDRIRPHPPAELATVLAAYCGSPVPHVVDLGCGTGISSRWAAGWAGSVVGVEPSDDMRAVATSAPVQGVRFVPGWSHDTGLPDASADVVLAVQALHWMEPASTFAEVARLLRPGGVFAAIDCDWPPTVGSAVVEKAWDDCRRALRVFEGRLAQGATGGALRHPVADDDPGGDAYSGRDAHRDRVMALGVQSWSKDAHLERMIASQRFVWCHELALHCVEQGDADRFVELLRSQGDYQTLRAQGLDDGELGVVALDEVARRELGHGERPWWFTYRIRVGVR